VKGKKSILRDWIESILIAGALALVIRAFFFQPYQIPTSSMFPTLKPGDKIFVSRLVYGPKVPFLPLRIPGFRKPQRGDVIVFVFPRNKRKAFIKRLIAKGGEEALIKNGNIYINGKIITSPSISKNYYYNFGKFAEGGKEITIPKDSYFVLGDNSTTSYDSRYWGFVSKKLIIGKAILIWWPPKRIGLIK